MTMGTAHLFARHNPIAESIFDRAERLEADVADRDAAIDNLETRSRGAARRPPR